MTADQWRQLQQKKTTTLVVAAKEKITETPIAPIQEESPQVPIDDVNPFGQLSDDASAVETVQQLIDPDPNRLPMIANNESPKAYAVLFAKAYWMQQHKAVERAELRREIGNCLLKFGVSRKGKENRASAVLESLKFLQQQQFELEKSTGSKLMGK